MNLFIYEHLTSGALAEQPLSSGLCHEGDAMLQALANDLLELDYQVTLLRDARLPAVKTTLDAHCHTLWCHSLSEFEHQWQAALAHYEYFIIIAPETDGILQQRVRDVSQAGKHPLNSQLNSIALCSDKYRCWQLLSQTAIATPTSWRPDDWLSQLPNSAQWVIKPIDGAGSEMTYLLDNSESRQYLSALTQQQRQKMIVQPYIHGETLSLSLFIDDEQYQLISINRQIMQQQANTLTLSHCVAHAETTLNDEQIQSFLQQVLDAVSGLWGFIGLDLIVDNGKLWLIEINPRLTSSYAEKAMRNTGNPARFLHQHLLQSGN